MYKFDPLDNLEEKLFLLHPAAAHRKSRSIIQNNSHSILDSESYQPVTHKSDGLLHFLTNIEIKALTKMNILFLFLQWQTYQG